MSAATLDEIDVSAEAALDLACESLYRFLAAAVANPRSDAHQPLFDPACQEIAIQAADLLREEFAGQAVSLGFGELPAEDLDARTLVAELRRERDLSLEYVRVFGLIECRECPPYETEYYPVEDTFCRSQQMADVAGFYRAFGMEPLGLRERPDHLSLELEFEAVLLLKKRQALETATVDAQASQAAAVCQDARASFFRDHVSWWLPSFALALRSKAEEGVYAQVGRLLASLAPLERSRLNVRAPQMPLTASLIESPDNCEGCPAAMS